MKNQHFPKLSYTDCGDHWEIELESPEATLFVRVPKSSNVNEDWAVRLTAAMAHLNRGEVA